MRTMMRMRTMRSMRSEKREVLKQFALNHVSSLCSWLFQSLQHPLFLSPPHLDREPHFLLPLIDCVEKTFACTNSSHPAVGK